MLKIVIIVDRWQHALDIVVQTIQPFIYNDQGATRLGILAAPVLW